MKRKGNIYNKNYLRKQSNPYINLIVQVSKRKKILNCLYIQTHQTFTCSESPRKTLEKSLKDVQS